MEALEYESEHRGLFGPGLWNQKALGPGPIPDPPATAYGLALLFGVAFVAQVMISFLARLEGKQPPSTELLAHKMMQPLDLTSLPSTHALLVELSKFGGILALCWCAEHRPIYPHMDKVYDKDLYWFVTAQLFLVALVTTRKVPRNGQDILGREQTEEWKGWMQFSFLMYHYFHAEDTYNAIRVMITCYVWMTGFGNFSFFYIKQDFSGIRLLQMLWRLNFLVVFLCLVFGNTYILYYICPLHTCFFFMVFAVMRVLPDLNHSQWGIRVKLAVVGVLVLCVWDLPQTHLYDLLFSWWMPDTSTIGAVMGPKWEWYFRSSLDHWSTYLGMIFALNYPAAQEWMKQVESLPTGRMMAVKAAASLPIMGALLWWATEVFPSEKPEYNATNAYFGCIPLLGYVFFRNLTPGLRGYYAHSLHELGKVTLETYLLQHHLWLTSNAKTLLRLVPWAAEWRACNMLLTTTLYFFASRELYRLTMSLRGMLLPDKSLTACWRNLGGVAGALVVSWVAGLALRTAAGGVRPSDGTGGGATPESAAPLLAAGSFLGGLGVATLLLTRAKPPKAPLLTRSLQLSLAATLAVVLACYCALGALLGEAPPDPLLRPKPVAPPPPKLPGAMAQPLLGAGVLAAALVMLASMDSYFGFPMFALSTVGGGGLTYGAAYHPLLEKLGMTPEGKPMLPADAGSDQDAPFKANEGSSDKEPLLGDDAEAQASSGGSDAMKASKENA